MEYKLINPINKRVTEIGVFFSNTQNITKKVLDKTKKLFQNRRE